MPRRVGGVLKGRDCSASWLSQWLVVDGFACRAIAFEDAHASVVKKAWARIAAKFYLDEVQVRSSCAKALGERGEGQVGCGAVAAVLLEVAEIDTSVDLNELQTIIISSPSNTTTLDAKFHQLADGLIARSRCPNGHCSRLGLVVGFGSLGLGARVGATGRTGTCWLIKK